MLTAQGDAFVDYQVVAASTKTDCQPTLPGGVANSAYSAGARETYEAHVRKYYGYSQDAMNNALTDDAPTSPEAIRSTIKRFTDAGFDELVFTATTADDTMASLDRLADVVGNL